MVVKPTLHITSVKTQAEIQDILTIVIKQIKLKISYAKYYDKSAM